MPTPRHPTLISLPLDPIGRREETEVRRGRRLGATPAARQSPLFGVADPERGA